MSLYVSKIDTLIHTLEDLRGLNAMIEQDATLFPQYFADPSARKDITEADATAAHDSLVQVLFAYDSGTPPQKAGLYKISLP